MDSTAETWLPIAGWEDAYQISTLGRVRSIRTEMRGRRAKGGILASSAGPRGGYPQVVMSSNGFRKTAKIHRLVAEAFLGPRPDGMEVCHNDGDVQNNAASNLRYASSAENTVDSIHHGTHYHARKTHCDRGHEFTGANIGRSNRHPNQRKCLECKRLSRQRVAQRVEAPPGALTPVDAAHLLGIDRKSVYVFARRYEDFPKPTKIGQRLFFDARGLAAWRLAHPSSGGQAASS